MSPTIRVDEEVWAWLKGLAQPFVDTPNTVLRRVAGLDDPAKPRTEMIPLANGRPRPLPQEATMPRRMTGEHFNRQYQLGARHALYHRDGTFYERLTAFPGVLCDPLGFVRYDSEKQFLGDSWLHIGRKVNVPRGLYSHPRYQRFPQEEPE